MKTLRFLQFSDLHFGARMNASRLGLPADKQACRQEEFRSLVRRIFQTARERNVDVVLAPGDIWDAESFSPELFHFFLDGVSSLGEIPLVITPGNHDYYSKHSFYHPDFLRANGYHAWPKNVHIFTSPAFETVKLQTQSGPIQVTGCAFQGNVELEHRLLTQLSPCQPDAERFHLLLFHGSRLDTHPGGSKYLTAPFTLEELFALQVDYAAVGHYHKQDSFQDWSGRIRGAYSGCTFARGLDETGPKGVLIGEIHKQDSGDGIQTTVSLESLTLDTRKIGAIEVSLTGLTHLEAIQHAILEEVRTNPQQLQPCDMIYCSLSGFLSPSLMADFPRLKNMILAELLDTPDNPSFHVHLNTQKLQPGFDFSCYDSGAPYGSDSQSDDAEIDTSIESRFYRYIQEKSAQTEDPAELAILENALKYGFHALHNHEISMLYEH